MTRIRNAFEAGFKNLARIFFKHRFKTIGFSIFLFMLMVMDLGQLRMDVTTEAFLHENDPSLVNYLSFKEQFGSDDLIIIGVETDQVFNMDFLLKLERLHTELEKKVPHLDDITSLVNVRHTRGEGDALFVDDLLEEFPKDRNDIEVLKKRVDQSRLYKNLIISDDFTMTSIVIKLNSFSSVLKDNDILSGFDDDGASAEPGWLTPMESGKAVLAVKEITGKYDASDFKIYLSGSSAVDHFLGRTVSSDSRKFLAYAYLTVSFFLALIFRRVSGVLIPLVIVTLTLFSSFGLMAMAGIAVKLPSQILPSFILAVSVGYSVHILALFYNSLSKGAGKQSAVVHAMGHSGFAVLMTAVTTAAGLFSFATSEVAPVGEVGIFAGAGVFIAMTFTFLLLPPLLSFVPEMKTRKVKGERENSFDLFLVKLAGWVTGHPVKILMMVLILFSVTCAGLFKFRFSHDPLRWLPDKAPIRISTEKLDHDLGGTVTMEIVIDTMKENGLYDPAFMDALEKTVMAVEKINTGHVAAGKIWSIIEILKESNRALNGNREAFYRLPGTRELTAQELFLFEGSGSDDLEDFTDSMFSKARISVKVPYIDAIVYKPYIERVNRVLQKHFPDASVSTTGMIMIYSQVIVNGINSMGKSYLYALATISLLMIIVTGSFRTGILGMIPNILPIVVTMGISGWLDVPVSLFTMLVGNIAIGLAVDDTIHFIHNFKKYFDRFHNVEKAVSETFLSAGWAMIITSVVLSTGFFIFMFSIMNHLKVFGALAGSAILLALVSNMVVSPVIMALLHVKKEHCVEALASS